MAEKLNLLWQSYTDCYMDMLSNEMLLADLSDITLVSEDKKKFKAHKLVLSACSPFFQEIITDLPMTHSIIYLKGIQSYEIESVLQLMYIGQTNIIQEKIDQFIDVAKSLQVKEFHNIIENTGNEVNNGTNDKDDVDQASTNLVKEKIEIIEESDTPNDDGSTTTKSHVYVNSENSEISEDKDLNLNKISKKSRRSKRLKKEQNLASVNLSEKLQCHECGRNFKQESSLYLHMKSFHEGVQYYCDYCDHVGSQKGNVQQHMKSVHEGQVFKCSQCKFVAKWECTIIKHKKTKHT